MSVRERDRVECVRACVHVLSSSLKPVEKFWVRAEGLNVQISEEYGLL